MNRPRRPAAFLPAILVLALAAFACGRSNDEEGGGAPSDGALSSTTQNQMNPTPRDQVQDGGRLTCYRARTGEALYEQERLEADGQYWASPIAADGKIYFASTRGNVTVIEASDTLNVLARNKLGERITATPAIADDKFYVRAANHLWAFGK